jgi:putative hydrolase of the HAD superfamily
MIRALLLDFDGVLRTWNRENEARAEMQAGLPAGSLLKTAFDPTLLLPAITGQASDETWRQQIAKRLRADHPQADAALAVRMWSESPGEIDLDVLSTIRSCHESIAVVLVTNATTRLRRDLEHLRLASLFDHVVSSAEVGCAKPEREIFARALAILGVTETEAFFIDDDTRNVAAAARLGIDGHVYQDLPQLLSELSRRNLIP